MADRWAVVEWLRRGLPYREIHRLTGVSVTTIGRVARFLGNGNGGYASPPAIDEPALAEEAPAPWMRSRLKLAVQKSGRLTDPSLDLLRALRPEALARQGSAHGLRREHAARCAVRARRRHSRSGAGGCLRSRARRPERARGEAAGARLARPRGALPAGAHARLRTLPAVARGAGRLHLRRARLAARHAASPPPIRSCSRATCASATSTRRSSPSPAPSRSRRASGAPTSSAISSPPARRCRPITCAKSRPCSRATRC